MTHDAGLAQLVQQLFSTAATPEVIAEVEQHGPSTSLWRAADELGLPLIGVAEERGGSGGSTADLITLLIGAGRHAVPLPLAETSLAAWMLATVGAPVPTGPLTVVPDSSGLSLSGDRVCGDTGRVPWLQGAVRVVAVVDGHLISLDPSALTITAGADLAGMPLDRARADDSPAEIVAADPPGDLLLRGALLRSAQMAGAIAGAFELTRRYVSERVQFGKPIAAFQSVQAHLVELAEASVLTTLAVERAALAADVGPASFEIAATASVVARHAALAVRAAHQAHGAIGMTQEYALPRLTRRLHAWRNDFGSEVEMNKRIGTAISRIGQLCATATAVASTVEI